MNALFYTNLVSDCLFCLIDGVSSSWMVPEEALRARALPSFPFHLHLQTSATLCCEIFLSGSLSLLIDNRWLMCACHFGGPSNTCWTSIRRQQVIEDGREGVRKETQAAETKDLFEYPPDFVMGTTSTSSVVFSLKISPTSPVSASVIYSLTLLIRFCSLLEWWTFKAAYL